MMELGHREQLTTDNTYFMNILISEHWQLCSLARSSNNFSIQGQKQGVGLWPQVNDIHENIKGRESTSIYTWPSQGWIILLKVVSQVSHHKEVHNVRPESREIWVIGLWHNLDAILMHKYLLASSVVKCMQTQACTNYSLTILFSDQ